MKQKNQAVEMAASTYARGVWNQYPEQHRDSIEQFWRDRYASNNQAVSPITAMQVPDGFMQAANGQGRASEGYFDAQKKLRDGMSLADVRREFSQRQDLMQENQNLASFPDRQRLKLLQAAEEASFKVADLSDRLDQSAMPDYEEGASQAFAQLMAYDQYHNHPIADPNRDLQAHGFTDQERFNWLHRQDQDPQGQLHDRKPPTVGHGQTDEARYFETSMSMTESRRTALPRPHSDVPLDMQQHIVRTSYASPAPVVEPQVEAPVQQAVEAPAQEVEHAPAQETPRPMRMPNLASLGAKLDARAAEQPQAQAQQQGQGEQYRGQQVAEAAPEVKQEVQAQSVEQPKQAMGVPAPEALGAKLDTQQARQERSTSIMDILQGGKSLHQALRQHSAQMSVGESRADAAAESLGVYKQAQSQVREQAREQSPQVTTQLLVHQQQRSMQHSRSL